MGLSPHTIKSSKGAKKSSRRVGRGNAAGGGTYAGRGLKGQRSRSGGKGGLKRRGFKQALQKVPKLRGFKSPHAKKAVVTLSTLERVAKAGEVVTPWTLEQVGVIARAATGVKIVARGTLTKKVDVQSCVASKAAVEAIEKAGGSISF